MTGAVRSRPLLFALAFIVFIAVALGALSPSTQLKSRAPRDVALHHAGLRVWSWNMNWLNQADHEGPTERGEEDFAALAKYLTRIDADVIVVQEVDGEEALRRVFDSSLYDYHVSSRSNLQRVAIVYKKDLEVARYPDLVALARVHSERLRYGVDIGVRDRASGQELRILGVHLKSGCFRSPLEGPYSEGETEYACQTLKKQLPTLSQWMRRRAVAKDPFMVVGDFNRRLGVERERVWEEWRESMPDVGLDSPTTTLRSRCWGGRYPEFIDHLVLDARARQMVANRRIEQLVYDPLDADKHGYRLSDHCPVGFD